MKKIVLLLAIVSSFSTYAQSYIGYLSDNYSGVNSVIANPANITDSRFKADINLAGFSAFAGNDYYGVNLFDAIKTGYNFDIEAKKSPSVENSGAINVDVLGPAFMFNLTKKSSIAVFTRARGMVNAFGINGNTIESIDNVITDDITVNEGDFNAFAHAWAELGVTYARVLKNDKEHFLKGGITIKYLQGGGTAYVSGKNITANYDADGIAPDIGDIASTGELSYGRSEDFDDDDYEFELTNASGIGADIGFVYEWRPNYLDYVVTNSDDKTFERKDQNKYKLKIGLSVTDIGSLKYDDALVDRYDITNTGVSEDDIENAENLDDILSSFYTLEENSEGIKATLPTALHFNADWNINGKFYANLNTDLSLIAKGKERASRISNIVSLTPRFESKWFSFYLPFSVIENNGFQAGAGLRAGPLYLGSGSVISALASDNTKGADVYAGLKIPIYQRSSKDRDGDGIEDKLDGCPKIAGPEENNGCPWGDKDNDSVLDNVDKCPEETGVKENNGCPWGDIDGDGVLDNVDVCENEPGPVENSGCPWKDTDGDGVYDKDDECIDIAGIVANKGCPEIPTVEVQKTLNTYAKTILFNSGKSSIKQESYNILREIVKILNEYPTARFSVEGHTDSVGSNSLNQKLSENRAGSVMLFLIENGVGSSRLRSAGFGEARPVASNATRTGRAQNRRVEINLVK